MPELADASESKRSEIGKTGQGGHIERQIKAPFQEGVGNTFVLTDAGLERRKPTVEEEKEMDRKLEALSDIFEGSDVRWQLDGAINISMSAGEYVGVHKDVDVSVETEDIPKLLSQIEKKGYGLFISYPERPGDKATKYVMERVTTGNAGLLSAEKTMVMAGIDEKGKVRAIDAEGKAAGTGPDLDFIDVHLIERDAEGNPKGLGGVVLPKEWYEARVQQHNGKEYRLSTPERVAYFKLHQTRNYDMQDLERLAETEDMSAEAADRIAEVVEREIGSRRNVRLDILRSVHQNLKPGMEADQVYEAFMADPRIGGRMRSSPEARPVLEALSKEVAAKGDVSLEQLADMTTRTFRADKDEDDLRRRVTQLKGAVAKAQKAEQVRKEIGGM